MVWSGLCFIPLASAAHPTRGPNALERRGLCGLVCVYTTDRRHEYRMASRAGYRGITWDNPIINYSKYIHRHRRYRHVTSDSYYSILYCVRGEELEVSR